VKEKLSHFFYYYKWHVIIAICVIALFASLLKSCTDRRTIDVKMVYFGKEYISQENAQLLEESLRKEGFVNDVDGDGEETFYMDIVLDDFEVDGTVDEATMSKIQTVVYAGDHTLLLAHQYALEDYDGCFADLSDKAADGQKVFKSPENDFVTGISVEGNTYLEEMGIDTTNLYVAMRRRTEKEEKKGIFFFLQEAAYEILDFILSANEVQD